MSSDAEVIMEFDSDDLDFDNLDEDDMEEAIEDFLEDNGIDLSDVEDIDMSEIDEGVIIIEGGDATVAEDIEEAFEEEDFELDGKVIEAEEINECDLDEILENESDSEDEKTVEISYEKDYD